MIVTSDTADNYANTHYLLILISYHFVISRDTRTF